MSSWGCNNLVIKGTFLFISIQDVRRFNTLVVKTIRLNCWDFSRIFSNKELCEISNLRSFTSVQILNDALMLHFLCTNPSNTVLTRQQMQHAISFYRFPDKIIFIDDSRRRIGRSSFINWAKWISKLIPFEWLLMNTVTFKRTLKRTTP